ncbi:MAG: hypothetical protein GEV13_16485 [Rhodospirillales bacterium]|nr:hypothetical protein [Rhodospirillales bacterium]
MSDYNALFRRYLDEANYYAGLYGLYPKTADTDGHWDAFRHAYASAAMAREYGGLAAHIFGDVNEVRGDLSRSHPQRSYAKHMDRWNNAVGRRLAAGAADNDEIADRIHDALKRGDLIIDLDQDARYYTGPTLVPSPYDYDRNRIHERPVPTPLGAAVSTGPSSPTLGINPHRYYGPYLGGRADIQVPEDHPLSQDEIERIRRGNGIPKGGLF